MRIPSALVLVAAILASGCFVDEGRLPETVDRYYEAYCERDVDSVLQMTSSPFYLGRQGPQSDEQLRSRVAQDRHRGGADCSARVSYDFDLFRTLTPDEVEDEFQITITEEILGYKPASSDVYVLVPARPGHIPDDPLQGFWRPTASVWEHVAIF